MPSCPTLGQLDQFLGQQLGDADMDAVVTHVEECASCQTLLENLTSDPGRQPDRSAAKSSAASSAEFLQAIKQGVPRASIAQPPAPRGYEILGELGHGGMGIVFKACQLQLKRLVALKMISAWAQAKPEMRARFRREAEAVARLQHPNIVQIHEIGEHDGQPYFCLEYIDGGNLGQRLAGAPQPPRAAAALVETLASPVHYAHQGGVIHRDLKPANILIAGSGQQAAGSKISELPAARCPLPAVPKITDFGLAKQLDQDAGQTQASAIMGTPSYMAPEQAGGDAKAVGPLADVYALGAILYEMLTGRPPFRGETALDTLQLLKTEEPVPVCRLQPKVPRDLETICLKCLHKEPRKRYADAAGLAEDLQRFLGGRPITARPTSAWEHTSKWVRRRPAMAALSATMILMVVSLLSVSLWYNALLDAALEDTGTQRDLAKGATMAMEKQRDKAVAATILAERRREETRWTAYVADMNLAQRAWDESNVARVIELLERQRPEQPGDVDYRGFEWHFLWRRCHSEQAVLQGHAHWVSAVSYSPDGGKLASASRDRTVRIWDVVTGKEIRRLDHTAMVYAVAFGSDDRVASGGLDGKVRIWDVVTGEVVLTVPALAKPIVGLTFNRDGSRLVAVSTDGAVKVWDANGGQPIQTVEHPGFSPVAALHPDGKHLATAADQTVKIWDIATGQQVLKLTGHISAVRAIAFSHDGRRLASASNDATVRVWDASNGRQLLAYAEPSGVTTIAFSPDDRQLLFARGTALVLADAERPHILSTFKGHSGTGLFTVAFRPDGRQLASAGDDKTVRLWDPALSQDGLRLLHPAGVAGLAYSPIDQRLASACVDNHVRLWDGATGKLLHTLRGHTLRIFHLAFSADASRLASGGLDRTVRVWDTERGDEVVCLRGHQDRVLAVAFGADRTQLASASADQRVALWDIEKKQASGVLKPAGRGLAISRDGRQLVSGKPDGTVQLWNPRTREEIATLPGHQGMANAFAFSRDGRLLASVGHDQTVRIWDLDTRRCTVTLPGFTHLIWSLALSGDGRRLAVPDDDRVRIYDVQHGVELIAIKAPAGRILYTAFNESGSKLATGSDDGTVRILDATPLEPLGGRASDGH